MRGDRQSLYDRLELPVSRETAKLNRVSTLCELAGG